MRSLDDIRREMVQVMGFVPPHLDSLGDAGLLEGLWQTMLCGYLRNPLPAMFKERLLARLARWYRYPAPMIMRCCHLYSMGLRGPEIHRLMATAIPGEREAVRSLRRLAGGKLQASPPPEGSPLELALVVAGVRIILRKDPKGGCLACVRECFGQGVADAVVLLGTYAVAARLWCDSNPGINVDSDPDVKRSRQALEAECPELVELWATGSHEGRRRRMAQRESRLVAELALQDRLRAAVEASEKRFRAVVASSPHPMMVYAEDGAVVMVNSAWSGSSGWDGREIRTLRDWVERAEGGMDHSRLAQEVDALYESDEPIEEGEVAVESRSGGRRVWTMTSAPLGRLPDGRRAVLRIGVDVTDRRGLESALWDANQKMSHILESVSDGFMSLDEQGRFLFVNREAERMLGLSRDDLVGRTVHDALLAPEGQAFLVQMRRAVEELVDVAGEVCLNERILKYRVYASPQATTIFMEDVTLQRRTQVALAQAQENLRLVASSIREVFWVQELPSLQVLYITPSYERLWGRSVASLASDPMSWCEAVHEADRQRVNASLARLSAGDEIEEDYRIVSPAGKVSWVRARWLPVRGADGRPYRVVGLAQDVTAQREAEASMRASQRLLRQVTDSLHAMVFMASPDGERMLYLSPGVEWIWQYTPEEAYALCASVGWQSVVHVDDRAGVYETIREVARRRTDMTVFCRIIRKDGELRQVRARCSAVMESGGEVDSVVGVAEEVIEERRAQELYRSLRMDFDAMVSSSPVAMITVDIQGLVRSWNPAAERLLGWRSDEVLGRFNPAVPAEEVSHLHTLHASIKAGRQMRGLVVPAIHKDGRKLMLRLAISPTRDAQGQVEGFLAVAQELRDDVENEPDAYSTQRGEN